MSEIFVQNLFEMWWKVSENETSKILMSEYFATNVKRNVIKKSVQKLLNWNFLQLM